MLKLKGCCRRWFGGGLSVSVERSPNSRLSHVCYIKTSIGSLSMKSAPTRLLHHLIGKRRLLIVSQLTSIFCRSFYGIISLLSSIICEAIEFKGIWNGFTLHFMFGINWVLVDHIFSIVSALPSPGLNNNERSKAEFMCLTFLEPDTITWMPEFSFWVIIPSNNSLHT